jgi:subtilisin family serine protease
MKRTFLALVGVGSVLLLGAPVTGASASPAGKPRVQFDVLAKSPASLPAAERAVRAGGGTITRVNRAVGLISAKAPATGYRARVDRSSAVYGVVRAQAIGRVLTSRPVDRFTVEREAALAPRHSPTANPFQYARQLWGLSDVGMDPLDSQLWGLTAVRSDLARTVQRGDERVEVGVIDTGIDGTHPDIAPNFDRADSAELHA